MTNKVPILLLGLVVLGWAMTHWKQATRVALFVMILEGAARKWVWPGAQELIYFSKDLLVLGMLGGLLTDKSRPAVFPVRGLYALLVASAVIGLVEVLNPNLPNVLLGLLGFRNYFLYSLLLFIVPAAFDSTSQLVKFLRIYALSAIPLAVLAAAQFAAAPGSSLNAYARGGDAFFTAQTFGSSIHVRVTATFSYISGYTSYLVATAFVLVALLTQARWDLRKQPALGAALVAILMGMFMAGSRGPVMMLAALSPLYFWLATRSDRSPGRLLGGAAMTGIVLAAIVAFTGSEALDAFMGRAAGKSDVTGRVFLPFTAPIELFPESGLFGFGIGSTHQAAASIVSNEIEYTWVKGLRIEAESGRVMVELGLVGFLFIYALRIGLTVMALRAVTLLTVRAHRAIAVGCSLYFLSSIPSGVVFDPSANFLYWYLAGVLVAIMRFDRRAAHWANLRRRVKRAQMERRHPAAANGPATSVMRQAPA